MHVSQLLCGEVPATPTAHGHAYGHGREARSVATIPNPETTSAHPQPNTTNSYNPTSKRPRQLKHKPYRKFYTNPTPSSHCHICARTSKAVRFVNCSKLKVGLCRKVICDKCFDKFGWDFDQAFNDAEWTCPHCRNACPPGKSQCFIYQRVNRKRESKRTTKTVPTTKKKNNINKNAITLTPLAILGINKRLPEDNNAIQKNIKFPRASSASTASNSSYSPPPSVYADPPSPYYGNPSGSSTNISPMSVSNVTSYGHQGQYQHQYQLPSIPNMPTVPAPDPNTANTSPIDTPAFRYGLNPQVLFNIPTGEKKDSSIINTHERCNIAIEKLLAPEPNALSWSSRQSTQWSPSLQLDKTCGIEMRDISSAPLDRIAPLKRANTTENARLPLPRLPPAPRPLFRPN